MAQRYQSFVVSGSGQFPTDMLRYDYCYPASSDDAVNMLEDKYIPIADRRPRQVKMARMVSKRDIQPTAARWASFGWQVSQVQTS